MARHLDAFCIGRHLSRLENLNDIRSMLETTVHAAYEKLGHKEAYWPKPSTLIRFWRE